ncbi:serine hydroxymethyltransferase [Patescibacteria group bacterium]|nr:serine hydroxymethyltransferase [Patescibacteria group bacterium]
MTYQDKEFLSILKEEKTRQENTIELIASENYVSKAVLDAQGSIFTNKYAEGYPNARYYGGCKYIDEIENLAINRARKLFNVEFVNVQLHSGSQANMATYFALLNVNDKILSMNLSSGGHLTHGSKVNFSGKLFDFHHYGVNNTGYIDYDNVLEIAKKIKPKMIVCGASAYSRIIDFKKFREIANFVGAYLVADISHIAGLIATNLHPSPVEYADVITSTTHKTLRGPRGAMIFTNNKDVFSKIQKSVFPGIQGGPMEHTIAAKAVSFGEVLLPSFKKYQENVLLNARYLSDAFMNRGFDILSSGTDNHLFVIDLSNMHISGVDAQNLLDSVNIAVSKSTIPNDTKSAWVTSGIRIGTPAMTSRGMNEKCMEKIADLIFESIKNRDNAKILKNIKETILKFVKNYPIPDYYE